MPKNDIAVEELRVPPHSVESEQAVLGGLLRDNNAWDRISTIISASDFYRYDHRTIFQEILRLVDAGKPADVITVNELLVQIGKSDAVGGMPYLNAMAQSMPSTANITRYAEMVRNRGILRKLIETANDICEDAYRLHGEDVSGLLDRAESKILAIGEQRSRNLDDSVPIQSYLSEVVLHIDELYSREDPSAITGVATGFTDIDRLTSGLQPGDLIVVAARPSMGKSALATNISENVAIESGLPVQIFSMEMSGAQLAQRALSSVGKVNNQRLRSGQLEDEDWPRITHAVQKINDVQIYIDETPSLSPSELRTRARRSARKLGKLGLVVVDYLQLMVSSDSRANENRAAEVSDFSRSLKALAKELRCPVIALSQLNRSLESRPNKRPIMSDLRESGAIEQDADVIIFLYRDEVYNPDTEDVGIAEAIISKQRMGPTGTVRLTWSGEYTRFDNYGAAPRN